jgi:D-alanyl-D-alanine carboxypeptidase (penicillin-binding protein 5/6)
MTDFTVLQEGRGRRAVRAEHARRARRRHRAGVSLAIGLLALGALLIVMVPAVTGPGSDLRHGAVANSGAAANVGGARAASTAGVHDLARAGYGADLAPPGQRISIGFKHPVRSGLLFDVSSGRVLWRRDPEQVVPVASLTKMMTALVVVEHASSNGRVLVTRASIDYTGSGIGLLPLHKYIPVETMLYGLLLPSGNDAAIALAQHVAGSESRFIAMMNTRARQLGLRCTHFTTSSGIVDRGNHSCATDLARLTHALLMQPRLARIVATPRVVRPFPIKGGKLYLFNNNPLLRRGYPGADGVKTGFTDAAGRCLVATARRGPVWLGVVLLHSQDPPDQATELLDAGFARLGSPARPAPRAH